jgi:putative PIN family toxin of toxin-antitoxin system
MRKTIVIDTSVLISALISASGPNREVLRRSLQGIYKPIISNALFLEYEDVSNRQEIVDLCPLAAEEIRELLNAFYSVCHWVSIYYLWRPNIKDEGDNFLIELALAGNAHYIITNNISDLLSAEIKFPNLRIVTPEQFLGDNRYGDVNNQNSGQ